MVVQELLDKLLRLSCGMYQILFQLQKLKQLKLTEFASGKSN
jgi:hypothetical protein